MKRARPRGSLWRHSVLAVGATVTTLAVCLVFSRLANAPASPVIFLIPIVLSAYLGGLFPGLVSTALSVAVADYFLTEPIGSFSVRDPADAFRLAALLAAGLTASFTFESLHRQKARTAREITERQHAEGLLAESEHRYHSLFENMVDALAYCKLIRDEGGRTKDFVYLEVNPMFAEATGLTDSVVGKRLTEVFPDVEKAHPDLLGIYDRVSRTRRPERFEIHFQPLQSWFSVSVYGLDDDHIVIAFQNITANKKSEQTIRHSEAELAAIYESVPLAVLLVDEHNRICKANQFAGRALGTSGAEMVGQRSGDALRCLHSLDSPEGCGAGPHCEHCTFRHAILKTVSTGDSQRDVETSLPLILESGVRDIVFLVSTAKLAVDGKSRILITLHDITERKQAEADLQHQLNLMKCITDQSADSIFLTDREGRVTFVNPEAEKVFGFASSEMIGRSLHEMTHHHYPDGREFPAEECPMLDTLKTGKTLRHYEDVCFRKDGSMADVSVSTAVLAANNAPVGIVYALQDITERKLAAAAKLRSQKLAALGTIAGGIAHDFNNILAAIKGNAQMALSELQDRNSVAECLSEIERAGSRAAQLVHRILMFGRPMEQKREIQPLQDVVAEALRLARATLPSSIEIRTEFAPDLPAVNVDASQMHQVILNLAINAAHAIADKPGRIDVQLTEQFLRAEDVIRSTRLGEGRYVRLLFSDNGSGMSPEIRERIFDPFFTTKPVGQGTGLGLSVVHGIVEKHEGAITVYSEPGRGSSFHVYLPAVGKPAERPGKEGTLAETGHGQRVLFVDDDEALVFLYGRRLKRLGYEVQTFSDPRAALRQFQTAPADFDIVITDVSMPHMSGFDLARELFAIRADLPIVVTSGYVRPEDQAKGDALGIRDIIAKPWADSEIAKTLNHALEKRHGEAKEQAVG